MLVFVACTPALTGAGQLPKSNTQSLALSTEPLAIRFESLSPTDGLTVSVTAAGDESGTTTFSNQACCGVESAQQFIRDVRITTQGRPLVVQQDASGWTVHNARHAQLTVTYRLPPTGPMIIDVGVPDQLRPIIRGNLFHVIGKFGMLLPTGRGDSDRVALSLDATQVANKEHFVSSLGPGNNISGMIVKRSQVAEALYLGGPIQLSIFNTPAGKLAVAYSAMDPGFKRGVFTSQALAIISAERKFFSDGQRWYLISLHGGTSKNPVINLGGGMGLSNSFAMFARSDLDSANAEHLEQFRLVLAHEYFHNWNGLLLRVASLPNSDQDDASVYWFSEGVTEFYTMRILTRAGLQTPARSKSFLNDKLKRYAANSRRALGPGAAGRLFWSDPDAEQIPYLRGYLAAWAADMAIRRGSAGKRDLDSALQALVIRAKTQPRFRATNEFLARYLTQHVSAKDAADLRKFILHGGDAPLGISSFAPCLVGRKLVKNRHAELQYDFADRRNNTCFNH